MKPLFMMRSANNDIRGIIWFIINVLRYHTNHLQLLISHRTTAYILLLHTSVIHLNLHQGLMCFRLGKKAYIRNDSGDRQEQSQKRLDKRTRFSPSDVSVLFGNNRVQSHGYFLFNEARYFVNTRVMYAFIVSSHILHVMHCNRDDFCCFVLS